jgi:hypothetical protein
MAPSPPSTRQHLSSFVRSHDECLTYVCVRQRREVHQS